MPPEEEHADPESQWALVTFARLNDEAVEGEKEQHLVAKVAALEHDTVLGKDGVLLVLPAQTVCRTVLCVRARRPVPSATCLLLNSSVLVA